MREVVRLRGDLQVQLQELQRFKPIQDVEAEATRLRIEAEAQRDDLVQGARNRLDKAEEKLQSAVAEADRIVAMANERAQEIAGDAFAAMGKAKELTEAARTLSRGTATPISCRPTTCSMTWPRSSVSPRPAKN